MSNYKSYNPNRSKDWNYGGQKWRLSRSKIDLFFQCPRCFYLDNKLGTKRPSLPSFNLNLAVDELLKKEFDQHREAGSVPSILSRYKIDAVPFKHDQLDVWRDFQGVSCSHRETGLVVCGAIDDVWITPAGKLIVVDYKATAKDAEIVELSDSPWDRQYRRQLEVYHWLLTQNGFKVEDVGYLLYANGKIDEDNFSDQLKFNSTLVPVEMNSDWVPDTLKEIKECLEKEHLPPIGDRCEYCPYREASGKKLLALHNRLKRT